MTEGESVMVAIRVRPPNEREEVLAKQRDYPYASCVRIQKQAKGCYISTHDFQTKEESKPFEMDFGFAGTEITQEEIFNDVGLPLVQAALSGKNVCLFAYGQTGSGKTHTMIGNAALCPQCRHSNPSACT
eukprot:TRINITY_DN484_c0_g1_i2.p2 TRINITY_DN484_c0_g1~~TRINITY_DN484_c0_g1_i2.p2  ORF type:complete len:130 (-),score=16.46 TRINITY_DN484_c0_g1_i2:327-716(-)